MYERSFGDSITLNPHVNKRARKLYSRVAVRPLVVGAGSWPLKSNKYY